MPVLLLGLGALLLLWFVPGGPSVSADGPGGDFHGGYVGDHYTFWHLVRADHAFTVKDARVSVTGSGCAGELRLVGSKPTEYFDGVAVGAMPGKPVIGMRVTQAMGPRLAIVLTGSGLGTCNATSMRLSTASWGRERWTTIPLDLAVNVTRQTGADQRAHDYSPPE